MCLMDLNGCAVLAAVHFYCIHYDNYNYHNISHTILDMATYIYSYYDSLCGYLQRCDDMK